MQPELALLMYERLYRIRRVEERVIELFDNKEIECPTHLCIGQEAPAVAVCTALPEDTYVFTTHRSHAHYIAKGGNLAAFFGELFGRSGGCSGGIGGSMHLVDRTVGVLGSSSIVGGIVPVAVGHAFATKWQKSPAITAVFFGDGAMEEGVVYESMNFAALHQLPVLFVCEDNNFATYAKKEVRQPSQSAIQRRAEAFMHTISVLDGYNPWDLYWSVRDDIVTQRLVGPWFLYVRVHRFSSHVLTAEKRGHYDTEVPDAVDTAALAREMKEHCPLMSWRERLEDYSIEDEDVVVVERRVEGEIAQAIEAARRMSYPAETTLTCHTVCNEEVA